MPIVHSAGGWSSAMQGDLLAREIGTLEIPAGGERVQEFRLDDFPGTLEVSAFRDGVPVPGALLEIRSRGSENQSSFAIETDDRGLYRGPLFPGDYDLVLSNGTESGDGPSIPIAVQSGRATVLTVPLD